MKKLQRERFALCLFSFVFPAVAFFCTGCGIISVLGTPTNYEREIPAEYDLAERAERKILVLVYQPGWLKAATNLRYYLTEAIRKNLMKKVKLAPDYLVAYNELSAFRSGRDDFSLLSPVEVSAALDADMVLFVTVEDYRLNEVTEIGYYKGFLDVQTVLLETETGRKLWPESSKSKSIKVGFEFEAGGREAAVRRLAAACAYCAVRYFYDCPKNKFKIADERTDFSWESWSK